MEITSNELQNKNIDLDGPIDFRLYLQNELMIRCNKNPSYSLRAFASFLGVSSSSLSAMMNGKRPITKSMRERLCLVLNLSPELVLKFESISRFKDSPNKNSQVKNKFDQNYHQLNIDKFSAISDWYHYAILQLMRIEGFEWNPRWISKQLGINIPKVNIAIDRLKRIGLLVESNNGKWIDSSGGYTNDILPELSSAAQRKLQKEVLAKAQENIDSVDISKRDNTTMTFAMNPEDIPFAKKEIEKFRRELSQKLESNRNCTAVYHLSVSLSPASCLEKGDNK